MLLMPVASWFSHIMVILIILWALLVWLRIIILMLQTYDLGKSHTLLIKLLDLRRKSNQWNLKINERTWGLLQHHQRILSLIRRSTIIITVFLSLKNLLFIIFFFLSIWKMFEGCSHLIFRRWYATIFIAIVSLWWLLFLWWCSSSLKESLCFESKL